MQRKGYKVYLPALGDGINTQLTIEQANDSRMYVNWEVYQMKQIDYFFFYPASPRLDS